MQNLQKLTNVLSNIETEFNVENSTISGMNGLIKAMQKGGKSEKYTQVIESELLWDKNQITNTKLPLKNLTIAEEKQE